MENQATNKIICRKCGGPHFTIKCGKEKTEEKKEVVIQVEKNNTHKTEKYNNNNFEKKDRKQYFKTTYRVKISDLPVDMTEEEMMELTCEWGHIVRIKVLNYNDSSVSYIDFGYKDEADYFIKAIDKTPFELILISVTRVDSYNPT
jgi:hypothetical protein